MYALLLSLLASLPVHHTDRQEPPEERRARMELLARSMDRAVAVATCRDAPPACRPAWRGQPRDLAVLLVVAGYAESGFSRRVHEGRCLPWECDPYRLAQYGPKGKFLGTKIVFQARGPWQLHPRAVGADWWRIRGADEESTAVGAMAAARHLSRASAGRGTNPIRLALVVYMGDGRQRSKLLAERLELARRLIDRANAFPGAA